LAPCAQNKTAAFDTPPFYFARPAGRVKRGGKERTRQTRRAAADEGGTARPMVWEDGGRKVPSYQIFPGRNVF
jgi:hypothetical protein